MATEKVHILRSSFLLPFGRLKVGSMPVVASHVMVSLSNHARALPPELFPKPFPNRGFSDFL
ncbi:MAG: hypothetical protein NTZ24_15590 [Deltaproteobacteria bacterium]|nr:hypothetical protein [Deltaproteobacteria bacterium]